MCGAVSYLLLAVVAADFVYHTNSRLGAAAAVVDVVAAAVLGSWLLPPAGTKIICRFVYFSSRDLFILLHYA